MVVFPLLPVTPIVLTRLTRIADQGLAQSPVDLGGVLDDTDRDTDSIQNSVRRQSPTAPFLNRVFNIVVAIIAGAGQREEDIVRQRTTSWESAQQRVTWMSSVP